VWKKIGKREESWLSIVLEAYIRLWFTVVHGTFRYDVF